MKFKKGFVILLMVVVFTQFISAIDLNISSKAVVGTIINSHDEPAVFDLTITNNGESADFEVFTFERFSLKTNSFQLDEGETKEIEFELFPLDNIKDNEGYLTVPLVFNEKGKSETQKFSVAPKLVSLNKLFSIAGKDITLESNLIEINFYNVEDISYDNIEVVFSSDFFPDTRKTFSLDSYEKKTITIPINKGELKNLFYGIHNIRAKVWVMDEVVDMVGKVQIIQRTGILTEETNKGFIIRETSIKKTNDGNVLSIADVAIKKNIISRLFTSFSYEPKAVNRDGFYVYYAWQKELSPNETYEVTATTNWLFPVALVLALIAIGYLANMFFSTHLVIKKKINFVKTKTNDFALKVNVRVKANKFMEKVVLYEKIPGLAKIHEEFPGVSPTKVDKDRGLLRWDLPYLSKGEERSFSYIIYSKMKVIGKFELPPTRGIYEIQGKIHETNSNKVYFINEMKRKD